jgi:hypothetical protein
MPTRSSVLAVASATLLAGTASAAITGTTGNITQIGPPASCLPLALPTGAQIFAWDEQQGINVALQPVDLSINPSNSSFPTPGAITTPVDSHFVHFDAIGQANGTITFNNPIVGVAYSDSRLDLSDFAGAGGTAYPTGTAGRGLFSLPFLSDFVDINGNVLTIKLDTISPVYDFDQIRVFTRAVPTPGSIAMLGAAGLLAARRRRN